MVKLDDQSVAVRCVRCRASAVTLSLVSVLRDIVPDLGSMHVYELSARGPLFVYLRARARALTYSEYFSEVSRGEYHNGIQCQDVEELTYQNDSFDICTSTEVFEHVAHDSKGFSELWRVLKPRGWLVFTVPLDLDASQTVERALCLPNGEIKHLLEPEYHGDPIKPNGRILAYRTYGVDILDRLRSAGFSAASLRLPKSQLPWGMTRSVIVAQK